MSARTMGLASDRRLAAIALTVTLTALPLASAVRRDSLALAPEPEVFSGQAAADVIHACADKQNGQLRMLQTSTSSCRPSEVPVAWNIQGPQGTQGPAGPNGPPGPPGVSGLERVDFSSHSDSSTRLKHAFARCPAGKHVVGGGANITIAGTAVGAIALKKSNPDDAINGWAATAEAFEQGPNWFVTAYALCANVAD